MSSCIDHLIITAPSLEAGAAFVRQTLGVAPGPGGKHPRMGTHNLLLRLGEGLFLEVIAIDPDAPGPARARWFGLDRLRPDSQPSLAGWVARTDDIRGAAAASTEDLGKIEPMTRGALDWHITIPDDGELPLGGAAPALIEWHAPVHPATTLQDHGLSLVRLEIFHPEPERISRLLRAIDFNGAVSVFPTPTSKSPYLIAQIETAHGLRTLHSDATTDRP